MSEKEQDQRDDIMNRLILDVKALVLLSDKDEALLKAAREGMINSHDEQVAKFMSLIQPARKHGSSSGKLITAVGELILASFLIILGLSLLAPSLMGLKSPEQLLSYFTDVVNGLSSSSLSNPLLPALYFVFALLLLLGSLYLLRHASSDLKDANLS